MSSVLVLYFLKIEVNALWFEKPVNNNVKSVLSAQIHAEATVCDEERVLRGCGRFSHMTVSLSLHLNTSCNTHASLDLRKPKLHTQFTVYTQSLTTNSIQHCVKWHVKATLQRCIVI